MRRAPTLIAAMFFLILSTSAGASVADGSAASGCQPWQLVPVPGGEQLSEFQAIDGVSSTDMWAVGNSLGGTLAPIIFHWDGLEWAKGPAEPAVGYLFGVDVIAASDAWAVGGLIMHWDGVLWRVAKKDLPGSLVGVSGTGPADVWAVGSSTSGGGLILHWDGASWKVVPFEPIDGGGLFSDVVAVAPNDAWAVGHRVGAIIGYPIIEHWNGTAWTNVALPGRNLQAALVEVDASGPGDAWAVGTSRAFGQLGTIVYHWDGVSWIRVNRVPWRSTAQIRGVSALGPNDVWIAGVLGVTGPPLAAHWNGTKWAITPTVGQNAWFNTIKAFSHNEVWAGGHTADDVGGPLSERLVECPGQGE